MSNSLLIIDDHPLYRDALASVLQDVLVNFKIVAVTSAEEGLRMAKRLPKLCLILLDLTLPGLSGVEAVTAFCRSVPGAIMIVISASEDRRDVTASIRAGASAFISKTVTRAMIVEVIQRALSGQLLKSEWIRALQSNVCVDEHKLPLSTRQLEILKLLAQGRSNRQIAEQVGLAEITVKQHITVIFRALGVENRWQALLAIRRFGFA